MRRTNRYFNVKTIAAFVDAVLTGMTIYGGISLIGAQHHKHLGPLQVICVIGLCFAALVVLHDAIVVYTRIRSQDGGANSLILVNERFGVVFTVGLIVWVILAIPAFVYRINRNIG